MDEQSIGRRVAHWRTLRKMSQQVFADRIGKSKSWVDKVERGVRRLDRFSVIYEIADVLQLDVQVLLGRDPARRPGTANGVDQVQQSALPAVILYQEAFVFKHVQFMSTYDAFNGAGMRC